jgi:hypothetical protein
MEGHVGYDYGVGQGQPSREIAKRPQHGRNRVTVHFDDVPLVQRAAPHHHAGSGRNCGRRRDRDLDGIARIDVQAVQPRRG